MKIILFTNDINKIGGIETAFYNLALFLGEHGHEVAVRATRADPFQMSRFKKAGIDIELEKAESCDLLINGSAWGLSTVIQAKLVAQGIHADWSDEFWREGGSKRAAKAIVKNTPFTHIFLPVSTSGAKFVQDRTHIAVTPMYNIAPKPRRLERKADKLVIAAFTRMTSEKGLFNYIALADRLDELGVEAELRVYTNGQTPVRWTAYQPVHDIATQMSDVSFVASLAPTESFGYTIAEANSVGVPCIIKRANSTGEFFDDKSNIIIDSVSEITRKQLEKEYNVQYDLHNLTRKNVLNVIKQIETVVETMVELRVLESFVDARTGVARLSPTTFVATQERAEEILSNKFKYVERV